MRKLERSPSSPTLLGRGRAAWKLARSSLPSMQFAHLAIADEQKKVSGRYLPCAAPPPFRCGGLDWLAASSGALAV